MAKADGAKPVTETNIAALFGSLGDVGEMSCVDCKANPPPNGYFNPYGQGPYGMGMMAPEAVGEGKPGAIHTTNSFVSKLIDYIPDKNLKKGLQEYMKIVDPSAYKRGDGEAGGHNAGVANYFSNRFHNNQCFQHAAFDFYQDVAATLKKQHPCSIKLPPPSSTDNKSEVVWMGSSAELVNDHNPLEDMYGCSTDRPAIDDHVGKGARSYLEDGWLLKLAMKRTNNNPEAALELIGMCGHDDVAQGNYDYYDKSQAAIEKNLAQVEKLKEVKVKVDDDLKKAFKKFSSNEDEKAKVYELGKKGLFLNRQIKGLSQKDGRDETLLCPPQKSDFFAPGSLADGADISPSLVEKVRNIQSVGPSNGHFIPAKYYHVYGSAFLGCKMVASGMTPAQAVAVQTQAARLYRGVRMCTAETFMLKARENLKDKLKMKDIENSAEVETKVSQLWDEKNKGVFECGPHGGNWFVNGVLHKENYDPTKCGILNEFNIAGLNSVERAIALKKINARLGRDDAAKLYSSWYFGGGSIGSTKLPCSDIRLKGPSDLMKPNEGILAKIFKPSGWSDERYSAASKKLATFAVDFEWTVAQHRAGSNYGAKLCADAKGKKNPFEEKACSKENSTFDGTSNKTAHPVESSRSTPSTK